MSEEWQDVEAMIGPTIRNEMLAGPDGNRWPFTVAQVFRLYHDEDKELAYPLEVTVSGGGWQPRKIKVVKGESQ